MENGGGDDTSALLRAVIGDAGNNEINSARKKTSSLVKTILIAAGVGVAAVVGYIIVKGMSKKKGSDAGSTADALESTGGAVDVAVVSGKLKNTTSELFESSKGVKVRIPSPFVTKDRVGRFVETSKFSADGGTCSQFSGVLYGAWPNNGRQLAMITPVYTGTTSTSKSYSTAPKDVTHAYVDILQEIGGVCYSADGILNKQQVPVLRCKQEESTRDCAYRGCVSKGKVTRTVEIFQVMTITPGVPPPTEAITKERTTFLHYSLSFDERASTGKKYTYARDRIGVVTLSDVLVGGTYTGGAYSNLNPVAAVPLWFTVQGRPATPEDKSKYSLPSHTFVDCPNCSSVYVVPLNEDQHDYARKSSCYRSMYALDEEVRDPNNRKYYWNYRLPRSLDIETETTKIVVTADGGVLLKDIMQQVGLPYRPDVISYIIALNKYADKSIMETDEKSWLSKFSDLPDGRSFWAGDNTEYNHKSYKIYGLDKDGVLEYKEPLPFREDYRLDKGDIVYLANMPEGYIHPDDVPAYIKATSKEPEE